MKKKLLLMSLAAVLICGFIFTGCGSQDGYQAIKENTEAYLKEMLPEPGYGDEWKIIGLARDEANVEDGYFEQYYQQIEEAVVAAKGELHARKYTEYSRVILALTAIGKDPADVGGYNLLEKLDDLDAVKKQGINGPIFALIALDSGNYGTEAQRTALIEYILSQEDEDGGFGLMGGSADCDLTAMAVQALAPYVDTREDVQQAVERALAYLETCEMNGAESLSQTIVALSAMGIDAASQVTDLSAYHCEAGGFCHELPEEGEIAEADAIATEQGYYALVAYERYLDGKSRLYDMQ